MSYYRPKSVCVLYYRPKSVCVHVWGLDVSLSNISCILALYSAIVASHNIPNTLLCVLCHFTGFTRPVWGRSECLPIFLIQSDLCVLSHYSLVRHKSLWYISANSENRVRIVSGLYLSDLGVVSPVCVVKSLWYISANSENLVRIVSGLYLSDLGVVSPVCVVSLVRVIGVYRLTSVYCLSSHYRPDTILTRFSELRFRLVKDCAFHTNSTSKHTQHANTHTRSKHTHMKQTHTRSKHTQHANSHTRSKHTHNKQTHTQQTNTHTTNKHTHTKQTHTHRARLEPPCAHRPF